MAENGGQVMAIAQTLQHGTIATKLDHTKGRNGHFDAIAISSQINPQQTA